MTTAQKRFGTRAQASTEATFFVNDTEFAARRLSVNEELRLADIPVETLNSEEVGAEDAQRTIRAMMSAIASLLQARALDERQVIDEAWVGENLTSADLENVVEFLRSGEVQ